MNLRDQKKHFENTGKIYESTKLTFRGVEGFDVYNPSIPFKLGGDIYIYGRVERRSDWARSWVRLFKKTGSDEWTAVPDTMIYQLEDPYVSMIGDMLVLGGTHVRYKCCHYETFYGYFYKGADVNDLYYFTTGPDRMKDIRIVQMADKRIGVFSRPRSEEVRKKYGSASFIGFTIIDRIEELNAGVIEKASYIPGIFEKEEWGGSNQAYLLDSGLIGVTGHKCYKASESEGGVQVYMNMSFVFDPVKHEAKDVKIIGTRSCYPAGPAKKPDLTDCVFTSGIVMRKDGRADLYSGIGDCEAGRVVIDYPFEGYGEIIEILQAEQKGI
jgi:hypothetical protein